MAEEFAARVLVRRRFDRRAIYVALLTVLVTNVGQFAWNEFTAVSAEAVNAWWQDYVSRWCVEHPPTAPQLKK